LQNTRKKPKKLKKNKKGASLLARFKCLWSTWLLLVKHWKDGEGKNYFFEKNQHSTNQYKIYIVKSTYLLIKFFQMYQTKHI
jgi:hypothetical protein